ncbi:SMR family transporter [Rubritalea tangerina]|uniref:SMR family transporter n=1 Tax=Rubritalea tangerina TaxID=430798 RepID=A0ABW4Z995_9BACT
MTTLVFFLVLLSACLHASWNFTARRVSGNATVVWMANLVSVLFLTLLLFWVESPFTGQAVSATGWLSLLLSGILHVAYYLLLGLAYRKGEVSIVYPVARGLGVATLPLILWTFFEESLSAQGVAAIGIIVLGILTLGIPALRKGSHKLGIPILIGLVIVSYSLADRTGANAMNPIFYLWGMMLFIVIGQLPFLFRSLTRQWRLTWKSHKKEIFLIGFADPSAYLIILICYTLGAASYIVALREFSVVIASFLGLLILKEKFTWSKITAISLITLGMILMKLA